MKKLKIEFSAASAIGSRDINQDIFLVDGVLSDPDVTSEQFFADEIEDFSDTKIFAICDGVGSFKISGAAAHAALQKIREIMLNGSCDLSRAINEVEGKEMIAIQNWGVELLTEAQKALLSYCEEKNCRGASSTISLLAIVGDSYVYANIGDSPGFIRKRDGEYSELSLRHNLATLKRLLDEEPQDVDERVLLYHLGDKNFDVLQMVNIKFGTIDGGDAFLLCSDGVANTLGDDKICQMLSQKKPSYVFVNRALKVEDADNCTAITVYVGEPIVEQEENDTEARVAE